MVECNWTIYIQGKKRKCRCLGSWGVAIAFVSRARAFAIAFFWELFIILHHYALDISKFPCHFLSERQIYKDFSYFSFPFFIGSLKCFMFGSPMILLELKFP